MNQTELIKKYGNPVMPYGEAGWRVPDVSWAGENLEHVRVDMHNDVYQYSLAHDVIVDALENAFLIADNNCAWRPKQFYAWSPRHKMLDPTRGLSLHAWGLAFDVDWDDNKVGTSGNIPLEVVQVFKNVGFEWGGDWTSFKDPMHFQWRDL